MASQYMVATIPGYPATVDLEQAGNSIQNNKNSKIALCQQQLTTPSNELLNKQLEKVTTSQRETLPIEAIVPHKETKNQPQGQQQVNQSAKHKHHTQIYQLGVESHHNQTHVELKLQSCFSLPNLTGCKPFNCMLLVYIFFFLKARRLKSHFAFISWSHSFLCSKIIYSHSSHA